MGLKRNQTAVYWAPGSPDAYGNFTFDEPVEVECRWEDKPELFKDSNGNEQRSSSIVYPDQVVAVGGYLYLGDLDSLSDPEKADPKLVSGAKEIGASSDVSNLKVTKHIYKAWL